MRQEASGTPRSLAKLLLFGLLAVAGIAALLWLGRWQLNRRVWKLELIDRVAQRIHADPVAAPGPADWPRVDAAHDEYRHVMVTGEFLNDRETLVQAVTAAGGGYWVLTPLQTAGAFTVLVNRGFVPLDRREPASRAAGQISGQTRVTGLIRITEPRGAFLRRNDPAADHWYSRDVTAISAARRLSAVAPYFIDADAAPVPGGYPVGGLTVIAFPNNHLAYALTWFSLALMLAGGVIVVGHHEWRLRRPS